MEDSRRNTLQILADPMTPEILRQQQAEGKTLKEIAAGLDIPYPRLMSWIAGQGDLSDELKRIREMVGHELAGEAMEIADTPKLGVEKRTKAGIVETVEGDMLGHRKLQVETRFKLAKAFAPKTYGEHQQIDWNVKYESEEEIRAKIRAALARNPELKAQVVGLLEAKGLTLEAEKEPVDADGGREAD